MAPAIVHAAPAATSVAAGSGYVAMGSSYAAGPGIDPPADVPATACARSGRNYAHQLAQKLNLLLTDVSCSGATTAALLAPWGNLPAQVDAVTADTRLVTITIGGNDVAFVRDLYAASCQEQQSQFLADAAKSHCPTAAWPSDDDFSTLAVSLHKIVVAIRQRAPEARIVFVDYPQVLPPSGVCSDTPMAEADADRLRLTAKSLAAVTAQVAQVDGALLFKASDISAGHDACGATPWMTGFPHPGGAAITAPYHPNLAEMSAVADGLSIMLMR